MKGGVGVSTQPRGTLLVLFYKPGFTVVTKRENLYSPSAWYVPFAVTAGAVLLLGLLGSLGLPLLRRLRARRAPPRTPGRAPPINAPEKKKAKKEVVMKMTRINTVFDGEARDPVTGRMYEFNTRSGARRWKKSNEPLQSVLAMQVMSSATENTGQGVDREEAPSKKEPSEKKKESAATKPAAKPQAGQSETLDPAGLRLQKKKEESGGVWLSSPAP